MAAMVGMGTRIQSPSAETHGGPAFHGSGSQAYVEKSKDYRRDVVDGRWIIVTRHARRAWEVIVEPLVSERLMFVVTAYARRHGVTKIRVFGSMARGDARQESDVDLLVDVGTEPSAWFPGGLVADLEELLGRRVQIITERGLDELLRDQVLEEAVAL
jgi:predicted nucleotidyltransferase